MGATLLLPKQQRWAFTIYIHILSQADIAGHSRALLSCCPNRPNERNKVKVSGKRKTKMQPRVGPARPPLPLPLYPPPPPSGVLSSSCARSGIPQEILQEIQDCLRCPQQPKRRPGALGCFHPHIFPMSLHSPDLGWGPCWRMPQKELVLAAGEGLPWSCFR